MLMEEGQYFLVLKYSLNYEPNCIALHKDLIEKNGYCWFGKKGKYPSNVIINKLMSEKKPILVLYSKNATHICDLEAVAFGGITEGIPDYYNDMQLQPDCYFKLTSMEEINISELSDAVVCSSGKKLSVSLPRSMASFTLYQFPGKRQDSEIKEYSVLGKSNTDDSKCKYEKNGKCNKRSFVNFEYNCERPYSCTGRS